MSSATPTNSDPDWLDISHYKTIAARRFADFYRKNLLPTTTDSASDAPAINTHDQAIQEEAAQWVLQRLETFNTLGAKSASEGESADAADVTADETVSDDVSQEQERQG